MSIRGGGLGSILKGPIVNNGRRVNLHQFFSSNSNKHPQTIALVFEGADGSLEKCSYIDVEERSNKLARALVKLTAHQQPNVDGDRIIGICLEPSPSVIISILAIWKSGCAYLPFASPAPINRTKHIVNESKPLLVITDQDDCGEMYDPVQSMSFKKLEEIAAIESSDILEENESYKFEEDPIIIIMYTSGSTGLSKGVRIQNSSAVNRLNWQWREMPFEPYEDYTVFKTSISFVDSIAEIWSPLLDPVRGRTLVIVPKAITINPQYLVDLLHKYKIERLLLVPSLLRSILSYLDLSNENFKKLENLRSWTCSGETLSVSLALQFFDKFPSGKHHLYNYYGSTEVMGDVSYHVMKNAGDVSINGKVPIGFPLDNIILYLLDTELKPVPLGEMGELYVAGSHLARGYVNKRDAFRFIPNPHSSDESYNTLYKTGDYARIVRSVLIFEGRTDTQIKVRGNRVDLSEVEAALAKLQAVQKGVVLCNNPGELDQQIVAFVLPENGTPLDQREVEQHLLNSVPDYAVPQVIIIEKMPYLTNGKVDRQTLLAQYRQIGYKDVFGIDEEKFVDWTGIPANKLEEAKCLFKTVADVLGKSVRGMINCKANFYSLGGNSLNSVTTILKLKEQSYSVSITDFIRAKDLGEICRIMKKTGKGIIEDVLINGNTTAAEKYSSRILEDKDKEAVFRIIADSFYSKSDIERCMHPMVQKREYICLLEALWASLVEHQVSIVALNGKQEIMGASLVFRLEDEPTDIDLNGQLMYVLEFLDYVEVPARSASLPEKGILHSFMLGTDQRLTPQENVEITEYLETCLTNLGKEKGYVGIFTTNTSPLTQQLAVELNYKALKCYQINQYVAPDGTRPFKNAPDDLEAIVSWKKL